MRRLRLSRNRKNLTEEIGWTFIEGRCRDAGNSTEIRVKFGIEYYANNLVFFLFKFYRSTNYKLLS